MKRSDYIRELFQKYKDNTCTPEELDELLDEFKLERSEFILRGLIREGQLNEAVQEEDEYALEIADRVEARLFSQIAQRSTVSRLKNHKKVLWYRIAAAASVILCLFIGGYFLLHQQQSQQIAQIQKQHIAPGGNKAILTLANGQKIVLMSAKNGILANQGHIAINKKADGQIVYEASKRESGTITYNMMTTPRGGQYHLTLADGTDVWLNAASSIKYPTAFTGKDRQVEITGEVYFEVAHNKDKPFRVITQGQTVEVLGTHFNINSYADEDALRTTLLIGSVKVTNGDKTKGVTIKPGEQASLKAGHFTVSNADTESAIAWQQGMFLFEDANIQAVMRQVARWYDVDVQYHGKIPEDLFTGGISRSSDLATLLTIFKMSHIHYSITEHDNRKILTINP